MLLTRSPLSPEPKPRFSLDLHVLSAPPAFVLSQDQTLREVGFVHEGRSFHFELALKGHVPKDVTRLFMSLTGKPEGVPKRSRRNARC